MICDLYIQYFEEMCVTLLSQGCWKNGTRPAASKVKVSQKCAALSQCTFRVLHTCASILLMAPACPSKTPPELAIDTYLLRFTMVKIQLCNL